MAQGLDVGTSFIVSARQKDNNFVFKTHRDAFIKLDGSNDFTKKMIANTQANFITKGNDIYIIGEEALSFANLLNKEAQRPLSAGIISSSEKEASNILEIILQSVAGKPQFENEILYYSVPAASIDKDNDVFFHEFTIGNILNSIGFNAKPINEALAVTYANLSSDNLSGLSLSFGAGMVNLSLALFAAPVIEFSIARSGDWIDQQVAKICNITSTKAQSIKEKGIDLSLGRYGTREESAIYACYKNLIEYVIRNFKQEFEKSSSTQGFDKPIKIVLSGGTSLPAGFDVMFEQVLNKNDFPLNIEAVVRANDPLNDVSKGCLIAAMAEES